VVRRGRTICSLCTYNLENSKKLLKYFKKLLSADKVNEIRGCLKINLGVSSKST
jgi:hypothetical protein